MHPNVRHGARRVHAAEFKALVLAQCREPGASVAAVAMANGVNANLVRKWLVGRGVKRAGLVAQGCAPAQADAGEARAARPPALAAMRFVPVGVAAASGAGDAGAAPGVLAMAAAEATAIHVELRRGDAGVAVRWPAAQAQGCAAWLSELAGALLKG
jgi:transposase